MLLGVRYPPRSVFSALVILGALTGYAQEATTLRYNENKGQWPAAVTFRAEAPGATVWCERGGMVIDLYDAEAVHRLHGAHAGHVDDNASPVIRHHAVRLKFMGTDGAKSVEGKGLRSGHTSYFLGNDKSRWASGVRGFTGVLMKDVWPGIDVDVKSDAHGLKYDFIVAAGADASRIAFTYEGADGLELRGANLIVKTSLGELVEAIPAAWQWIGSGSVIAQPYVRCAYRLENNIVSISTGEYYKDEILVIDPTLSFSTYSGSFSDNFGYTATYDDDGFLYSGSSSFGSGYPTTVGAYQTTWMGGDGQGAIPGTDIAITKYDTTGTFIVWSTMIGGQGDDLPHSLIVNDNDEVFILGTTGSPDFPTTAGSYDLTFNGGSVFSPQGIGVSYPLGSDMVVVRLSNNGQTLLASTHLGGTGNDGHNTSPDLKMNYADEMRGEVLLDDNDNVYIISCTESSDFPVTANAAQQSFNGGTHDGVVVKMDASLTTLLFSTYFGGGAADACFGGELDENGDLFICGGTASADLPSTSTAYQQGLQGGQSDAFVAHITGNGSSIDACSYYGSSAYDQSYFVDLDQDGNVFLFGQTLAPGNQLIFNAPYNVPDAGQFIAKLDNDLTTLLIGSRFGVGDGTLDISPTAFLVDYCNKLYVSGWGSNIGIGLPLGVAGMAVTPNGYQTTTDGHDFYLAVFEVDMSNLFYGTFFGGGISHEHVDGGTSRFDRRGRVYQSVCAGCGGNSDFPIEPNPGAVSAINNSSNCNNGVFKFDFDFPIVVADFDVQLACMPTPIIFDNNSYGAAGYLWLFGDNNTSSLASPTHVYASPGVYDVTLIAFNPSACNEADTVVHQVVVLGNSSYDLQDTSVCLGGQVQIGLLPIADPTITYIWSPPTYLSSTVVANPVSTPQSTTTYTLIISNGICTDTVQQTVAVDNALVDAGPDTVICGPNSSLILSATASGSVDSYQWSSNANFTDWLNNNPADPSVSVSVTQTSTFWVMAVAGGCIGMDSVTITVEMSDPELTGDTLICADETASLQLTGVPIGSTIVWGPANEVDAGQGTTNAQTSPAETTTFTCSVTTPAGCLWNGTIDVIVSEVNGSGVNASVDQPIVLLGTTDQLNATPTTGVNYSWLPVGQVSDPNIANPTATITQTTTFYVTVSDGICTKGDSVTVTVYELNCGIPDIYVPNAFTPNADGNNDVLFVRGRFITSLEFKIFDRWGELVFSTTDQSKGWDATFKDKPVDPAVFVYWLKVRCADGQEHFEKGNVTVIR
ncbi:MAG: gliding motility-associated C-terminal domain-containing protein [Flavobacteriales bacterium]|nr:gliding motility-associated C-terminal domain-containing protein [Flavobacteriales bacterium]